MERTDNQARRTPAVRKRRFHAKTSTLIFYIIYLTFILAFFLAMDPVLTGLRGWLVSFEASQPNVKCEQVFQEMFAEPDWAALYTMAGGQDTEFEGKDTYAAYMEQKVGDSKLTYSETSAGLSGDKKYIVSLGKEKIATFTLTSEEHEATQIAQWELGKVEIFFSRSEHLTIRTIPGYTVALNGVTLDDRYIIRTVSTTAEEYLPEGLHGYRMMELEAEGFLMQPLVTVTDPAGNTVEMTYDPKLDLYSHPIPSFEISDAEYATVLAATQAYCKYMIRDITESTLKQYFDGSTALFKGLRETDPWMQKHMMKSYAFSPETISGFYRYSDELYSARVELTLQVTRTNGSVKPYPVTTTFFFSKNAEGKWLVTDMTNVDIQVQTTLVRLQFLQDGELLHSEMVDAAASQLLLPNVLVPEGKTFAGWFMETLDEKGNKTMHLVFAPSEDGTVILPEGMLEPMTLYALFE